MEQAQAPVYYDEQGNRIVFVATATPSRPATNGFAIASMVLGILWLYWVGSILALIFGYKAKRDIAASGEKQAGAGMATAGIVLGWIGVATFIIAGGFLISGLMSGGLYY